MAVVLTGSFWPSFGPWFLARETLAHISQNSEYFANNLCKFKIHAQYILYTIIMYIYIREHIAKSADITCAMSRVTGLTRTAAGFVIRRSIFSVTPFTTYTV